MTLYESIPDQPDRDTDDHNRMLYAKSHTTDGTLKIMAAGADRWIESDTFRANYR